MLELAERPMVELDVGLEPPRIAADDRQRERKAIARRANHRLRAAADTDPGAKRRVLDPRKDADAFERRTYSPFPPHRLTGPISIPQRREDCELLLEQDVVVIQRVAEEGERFGERASAENYLCPAVRHGLERTEALIDPY